MLIFSSAQGSAFYRGEGVRKGVTEAVKWYRKAVDRGHALVQLNFGLLYAQGDGLLITARIMWLVGRAR